VGRHHSTGRLPFWRHRRDRPECLSV